MGILDQIITNQNQHSLEEFDLRAIVKKVLEPLKEREQHILTKRYGLLGNQVATLKAVGEEQGLTRERVRQIEKDLLKHLRKSVGEHESFTKARDFVVNTINEHGGVMAEHRLLDLVRAATEEEANSLRFLLNLIQEIKQLEADFAKTSWVTPALNKEILAAFVDEAVALFNKHEKPLDPESFVEAFKKTDFYGKQQSQLPDKTLLNYLHAADAVERNIFGEFGIDHWSEIRPKDVGDKAYLVMKHHEKPEHYSVITDLINKHSLDKRTAYKETVHNKLIKDKRFVLVGRGIYALAEWGYRPGVVAEMIVQILKDNGRAMQRDEIVEEVLRRRMVKKNTILVGLSNKKYFKKTGKNLYDLVERA